MTWREHAACVGTWPEMWHDPDDAYPATVCARCPVRRDCALEAVALGDEGCWRAGTWIPERPHRGRRTALENLAALHNTTRQARHTGERSHCKKGHPLEGSNVLTRIDGHRRCRTCHNENRRNRKNPAA